MADRPTIHPSPEAARALTGIQSGVEGLGGLEVIAKDFERVKKTKFYRSGFDRGYIDEAGP